ncbi:MAG TPA: hypothetical protein VMB71_16175 [Acetobacteraceae bacterium]|nr:hypothetical protein [Acetobacteraceae bacterium]HUN42578.1 hypothetical protein [Acetobacteraceae bacterium]
MFRDAPEAVWRRMGGEAASARPAQATAALSSVVGGHFPLSDVPRYQLAKTRDRLAEPAGVQEHWLDVRRVNHRCPVPTGQTSQINETLG